MFSGSTDSTKCALVAKPTRSQELCSHFLKKHSCFCNACIVTWQHQSQLKHQQGAQRKWLDDAFSWPDAPRMWYNAALGSNAVTAPGSRFGFQKQIWTTHSQRSLGIKESWLTRSHGNQQHLQARLSHPAPFQAVIFAFCPQLCQTLQLLPIYVNHWLISEAPRGGGRAQSALQRGYN